MCLQGKARDRFQRVDAGGRQIWAPSRITATSWPNAAMRPTILEYSPFAGSTTTSGAGPARFGQQVPNGL